MVMYTVSVAGECPVGRTVTLVFQTTEGGMWGPWSSSVRVPVDDRSAAEQAEWTERPADRFVEVSVRV
jgi:hypothetical protein